MVWGHWTCWNSNFSYLLGCLSVCMCPRSSQLWAQCCLCTLHSGSWIPNLGAGPRIWFMLGRVPTLLFCNIKFLLAYAYVCLHVLVIFLFALSYWNLCCFCKVKKFHWRTGLCPCFIQGLLLALWLGHCPEVWSPCSGLWRLLTSLVRHNGKERAFGLE